MGPKGADYPRGFSLSQRGEKTGRVVFKAWHLQIATAHFKERVGIAARRDQFGVLLRQLRSGQIIGRAHTTRVENFQGVDIVDHAEHIFQPHGRAAQRIQRDAGC